MAGNGIGMMGWRRDLPDFRDYTRDAPEIGKVLAGSRPLQAAMAQLPDSADLVYWCSPVEDQRDLGSCTAHAGVGLLEYFQRRAFGKHLDASRLFLYKVTRKLDDIQGDQGAYLRTTMKAMVLFGVPPENHWKYFVPDFDEEPPAFCYAFAQRYRAMQYYRHDPAGRPAESVLQSLKECIAAGLPAMFGFVVYSSIPSIGAGTGDIPFPAAADYVVGGHAIVAMGYDDHRRIGEHEGALMIRNSWGEEWGEQGYGWLPYEYVLRGLAVDFWSLIEASFVDTDLFTG